MTRAEQVLRELGIGPAKTFRVGEHVVCRGNFGPLIAMLTTRYAANPDALYEIVAVRAGWLTVADEHGTVVADGIGASYFRIAGECVLHQPHYDSDAGGSGWICARCDAHTPEASSRYWLYHPDGLTPREAQVRRTLIELEAA